MKREYSSVRTERERGVCTQMCCSLMMFKIAVCDSQPYSSPCCCAFLSLVPAQGTWLSLGPKSETTSSGDTQGLSRHISGLLSAQIDPPRAVSHAHCWPPQALPMQHHLLHCLLPSTDLPASAPASICGAAPAAPHCGPVPPLLPSHRQGDTATAKDLAEPRSPPSSFVSRWLIVMETTCFVVSPFPHVQKGNRA